jgi:N-carbamoylputrescine amidase
MTQTRSQPNTRIALIQMSCEPSTDANLAKAADRVLEAARLGANIVCLPELFRAQYFCQREEHALFDTAESIPGPSTARLSAIAREHNIVIIASLFERRAPGLYHNTAAILDPAATAPDNIAGIYRKMHIPDDPLYYEKFYFTPGDLGFKALTTTHGNIGTLVCWDQWYPEAARVTSLMGANTLFYPTAIGWHPSEKAEYGEAQYSAWQTMQRAHAIANGVFVGAVNRVGHEHGDVIHNGISMPCPGDHTPASGLEFWGGSFIADPFGRVIAQASHDKEEILTAEIDLKLLEDTRRNWPFLRDRRIDAYQGITSRFLD